jgi:hypothetical protein
MNAVIRRLRAQVAHYTQGKSPTAVRYPARLRGEVLALARQRRAQGVGVAPIARELGVAPWTLALWLRRRSPRVLRAVTVAPDPRPPGDPATPRPVLVTPQGFRIEGLDLPALVTLLRALA